jgi:fibronectin type 3 domain-containing protein
MGRLNEGAERRPRVPARRRRHRARVGAADLIRLLRRCAIVAAVVASVAAFLVACSPPSCADPVQLRTSSGLRVTQVTATSAVLNWSNSPAANAPEGYRIYRGPSTAGDDELTLIDTADPGTAYSATNLLSAHEYKFGVAAIDINNVEAPIQTATITTADSDDADPPQAPTTTSVALSAFSSSRIDIVWGASRSADVAYYEIRRDDQLIGTVERPGAQRYSDNGLEPDSTHSYTITAYDSASNRSEPTAPKAATTLGPGEVRIARGPVVSDVSATAATISWWTNIPSVGSVELDGRDVPDTAGSAQQHIVRVPDLSPGSAFSYVVTSGSATADGTFRTAAAPGTGFSFAAIGDFGSGNLGEDQNATNIAAAGTQFVQTVGDNVYPSSGLPDPDFGAAYSDFDARLYSPFREPLRSQAFFPANGNQEYYSNGAFWRNFPMPGGNHSWYSYDWGDAHVLVLDTERPFGPGSEQYAFARADLASSQDRAWRIVAMQRPPYSSTSEYSSSAAAQRDLVPLFQIGRVGLVLSGNSHNYERTVPLINGEPTSKGGITYVVTGGGGNSFNNFTTAQPPRTAFREDTYYEFVKVTVSPTTLAVEAVAADTNAVFDSTTIQLDRSDTVPPSSPTGLSAGPVTASTVSLSWRAGNDDVAVAAYEIFRDRSGIPVGTSATTDFVDSGLTPGTGYAYTVVAVDEAGNRSAPSFATTVTTLEHDDSDDDLETVPGASTTDQAPVANQQNSATPETGAACGSSGPAPR